jgi:hypothetical protein
MRKTDWKSGIVKALRTLLHKGFPIITAEYIRRAFSTRSPFFQSLGMNPQAIFHRRFAAVAAQTLTVQGRGKRRPYDKIRSAQLV